MITMTVTENGETIATKTSVRRLYTHAIVVDGETPAAETKRLRDLLQRFPEHTRATYWRARLSAIRHDDKARVVPVVTSWHTSENAAKKALTLAKRMYPRRKARVVPVVTS